MISRLITDRVATALDKKAVVILGPRQVGKSTLLHQILDGRSDVLWLNGDDFDTREIFSAVSAAKLKTILGPNKILALDEAQRIDEIGLKLKILIDQFKDIRIIATGSSSLDLAKGLTESMTGRKREFQLLPMSFNEMVNEHGYLEENRLLHRRLLYGYYPEVVTTPGEERDILREISNSYLYKDILSMDMVARPQKLGNLVQALAYQIGSQVSYNELAKHVGLDSKTVEKYIDILEKCFVIFRVRSFSRNLRNELKASNKFMFWDLGIRNAVINNFAPIEMRSPIELGAMWENWIIAERLKYNNNSGVFVTPRFWRTKDQAEVDYVEEIDGAISAYEFKWNTKTTAKISASFVRAYPEAKVQIVTPDNFANFVGC